MAHEEVTRAINLLTYCELTVFVYKEVFGLSVQEISRHRNISTYRISTALKSANDKLTIHKQEYRHDRIVSLIQELFEQDRLSSFFDKNQGGIIKR